MNTADANERISRAGWTPRQRRWFCYRALVRGQQYTGRNDWWTCEDGDGNPVLSRFRRPLVQLGECKRIVNQLVFALVGKGKDPKIVLTQGDAKQTDATERVAAVLELGLRLPSSLTLPVVDLLGGACILGFSRPDPARPGRLEFLRLQPEWCDPVIAARARGRRARQYASDLQKHGVSVPEDEEGPHLPIPSDARWDDVVFLRHQVKVVEEMEDATHTGGVSTASKGFWERTDWLPDAIIEYEPVPAVEDGGRPPREFVARPWEPHGWGLVPIVWVREWSAEPDELEGDGVLDDAVQSMAEQADYVASFGVQGTNRNADPDVFTIGLERIADAIDASLGVRPRNPARTTGGRVFDFEATSDKFQIGLLESQGTPQEASREQLRVLRQAIADNSGVVRHDPEKAVGVQSGEAMKRMMMPFLALTGAYQEILGEGLVRLVSLLVRVMVRERQLGAADIAASVEWPEAVSLTAVDAKMWADVGVALQASGYPLEEIVRLIATKLGHPDPDELASTAAADAEAQQAAFREQASKLATHEEPDGVEE